MQKLYVLLYRPGHAWLTGKPMSEQALDGHLRYLRSLHAEGIVKSGGPFANGLGGLGIVQAADLAEAEDLLAWDPAVRCGTLAADIFEWRQIV